MQIKADILGVPLTTMKVTEATCMGAAMLAGGRTGDPWAEPIKTFEPRTEFAAMYEDRFAIYKEIYSSLAKARDMLSQL